MAYCASAVCRHSYANGWEGIDVKANMLRPGLMVDGRKVISVVPTVKDRAAHVSVKLFGEREPRVYRADADVPVIGGYREPLPAARVAKRLPQRVFDGGRPAVASAR